MAHICNAQIFFSSAQHTFIQCTNVFLSAQIYFLEHKSIFQYTNVFLSAQMYFWVHKLIFQGTNVFLSAQIYFSVHKCNSQCTNVFSLNKCIFSAQMYFSVHKCISQCTNIFFSAQIYFSVHKCISQCTNIFLSAQMYFSVHVKSHCTKVASMKSVICQCTCRVSVSEFLQVSYFLVSLFSSVGGHFCSSRAIQDSFLLLWRKRDSKVSRLSLSGSLLFRSEYHIACYVPILPPILP